MKNAQNQRPDIPSLVSLMRMGSRRAAESVASARTTASLPWRGVLAVCLLAGWLVTSPGWAASQQVAAPPSRFRLWHDLRDVFTLAWRGTRTAFALPTLYYLLPSAAIIGGASFADDEMQAVFEGNDEDDALAQAGTVYAGVYFGAVQAGLYLAGELSRDPKLSSTGKKAMAALLGTAVVVQTLKPLTRRERPDGSGRRSFPSFDAATVSSIIPTLYVEYGVIPAVFATASAAFVGFARIYGNKHHLSDVLTGYALGVGWGVLVEMYARSQHRWALLPVSNGRNTVGLAFHLRF